MENKSLHTEFPINHSDKLETWVEVHGDVISNSDGVPVRFFGTSIDITDKKRTQLKLEAARDEADRANAAKSTFLANMSHEIRTPVGAIMGFVSLLREGKISDEDAEEFLGVIDRNSKHLLRIIDDVLDLSKVEANRFVIEHVRFSLTEFLAEFSSFSGLRAREKGVTFLMRAGSSLPEFIVSDPTRIRQILTNITTNAIKFTTRGRVELIVNFTDGRLVFTIIDTGIGISPSQQKKLFSAFSQADSTTTRRFGGSGLGLVLAKKLSRLLGGDFVLKRSEVGVGSEFEPTILAKVASDSNFVAPGDVSKPNLSASNDRNFKTSLEGMSILLVEDSPENRTLVKLFLKSTGAKLTTARNGREGVEKCRSERFDVVLMDIQMPEMDGHEAVGVLRKEGYNGTVVALTAHVMDEEKERAIISGFSHFLSKPIIKSSLIKFLRKLHLDQ